MNEYEKELPFDVPDNWLWCNLGLLFNHNTGKALNSSNSNGSLLTYITTSNVYWDRFELENLKIMPYTDSEIEKCTVKKGDLLVCEGGEIGRAAIWEYENEIRIQNHLHRLRAYDSIQTRFYYYILYLYKLNGKINGKGIGLQGLSSNALHAIIVPVPPYQDQKRIVIAIERIFSLILEIESYKDNLLEHIKSVKSKILDLAIRGKLVQQSPDDEPASVLLERIRAEKEELIKQGKIKRDKNESVIFKGEDNSYYEKFYDGTQNCINEEIPFEVPASWIWCRLGTICTNVMYGLSNSAKSTGTHKLLRITDIQNGSVDWEGVPFTTVTDKNDYLLKNNDIVFTRTGATVGKSFLIKDVPNNAVYASYLIRIKLNEILSPEYIYRFFNSECYWNQITDKSVGVGQPNCNGTSLKKLLIPIPPLLEQPKIVMKANLCFFRLSEIEQPNI